LSERNIPAALNRMFVERW